ncbi:MAG: hypothetical protein PGN22_05160 [Agrobacterium cavarae]
MTASLYRHFNASGDLLYVGCSNSVLRRTEQHESQSEWFLNVSTITVQHFADGAEALAAEAEAILSEHPRHNVRGNLPDIERLSEEREEWNAAALAEYRQTSAALLAEHPGKLYFSKPDLARASLTIPVALLQSGLIRKRKFGRRDMYTRTDIQTLADAPDGTWVIPAARIIRSAA